MLNNRLRGTHYFPYFLFSCTNFSPLLLLLFLFYCFVFFLLPFVYFNKHFPPLLILFFLFTPPPPFSNPKATLPCLSRLLLKSPLQIYNFLVLSATLMPATTTTTTPPSSPTHLPQTPLIHNKYLHSNTQYLFFQIDNGSNSSLKH